MAVAVAALLVSLGVLDPDLKDVILGLVSSLLVVGGVEKARSRVTPTDA